MKPLSILILSDGRPGHFNLSEGIAAAVARSGPAEIQRFDVRRGRWSGAALAAMTTGRLPAKLMLERIYGIAPASVPRADLIVSAGAETLAASIWLSRYFQVPNVHYGSLRLFDPQDFALVLTSYERSARRPNHVLALKPSRLDPDALTRGPEGDSAGGADARPGRDRWPPELAALVIGGDTSGIVYTPEDWRQLLAFAQTLHRDYGTRWRIANSRRTPEEVSAWIAGAVAAGDTGIDLFLDIRTAGAGTLGELLGPCEVVICTADSSSMVSESVWMQLPTLAVAPMQCRFNRDEMAYRAWIQGQGWARSLAISELSPLRVAQSFAEIQPMRTNPQEALASLIQRRVPGFG